MNRKRGVSNTSSNTQRPPPSTKKVHKPCFNFNKGVCRFGEYCKLLHNGVHGSPSRSTKTSTEPHNDDMKNLKNLMDKLVFMGGSGSLTGQETIIPSAFNAVILQDLAPGNWNMDTGLPYSSGDEVLRRVTNPLTIPYAFLIVVIRLAPSILDILEMKCYVVFIPVIPFRVIKRSFPFFVMLGKHVKLLFVSYTTLVHSCFDIVHSDLWTSPIPSLSRFKY
ncbi:ribonuclease H-like domain-containing protein [Tanacetum coccineum]